jgi:hypothetical protein
VRRPGDAAVPPSSSYRRPSRRVWPCRPSRQRRPSSGDPDIRSARHCFAFCRFTRLHSFSVRRSAGRLRAVRLQVKLAAGFEAGGVSQVGRFDFADDACGSPCWWL